MMSDEENLAPEPDDEIDAAAMKDALSMMKEGFLDMLGISLRDLSKKTGIPKVRLQKLFAGKGRTIDREEMRRLHDSFDLYHKERIESKKATHEEHLGIS